MSSSRRGARIADGLAALTLLLMSACGKTSAAPPPLTWYELSQGEAIARAQHKPVVVFVRADWSVADKDLEEKSFPDGEVRAAMKDFVAIRVDATDDDAPTYQRAARRFRVIGVPAVIVLRSLDAPDEAPNEVLRFNEFVEAPKLAAALRIAKLKIDDPSK